MKKYWHLQLIFIKNKKPIHNGIGYNFKLKKGYYEFDFLLNSAIFIAAIAASVPLFP
jgi:hypothetical protein